MKHIPTFESFVNESIINEAARINAVQPIAKEFMDAAIKKFGSVEDTEIQKVQGGWMISVAVDAKHEGDMYDWGNEYDDKHKKDLPGTSLVFKVSTAMKGRNVFWPEDGKNRFKIEESVTEASKKGLDVTQWSKWPDSKTGDVFKSKRQGVLAVRVDNALRPMHYYTDPVIWMNQCFDTDKQFTEKIKSDSKSIADAYYEMHNSGSHTREKADAFGKAAEDAIKKIVKGEKLPMPVVLDGE